MKAGDLIGAWALERPLGRGEAGATWIARRAGEGPGAGSEAVLKILDVGEARDWTGYELFGREVEALKSLSHPGIPRFIESFEEDAGGDSRLVLAMELVPGLDLEALVSGGRRFTEAEVAALLAGLADIIAYLASLRPPVVHRDVNPRNVLLAPDGRVSLVDFSGAQEALRRAANPGATLIGTAGYIPLEQVSGRASARSDLYGAAATALFLLTRRNPAELPLKDLKPDLASLPSLGRGLGAVLDSWLEPDESRRSLSPADAARILRGQAEPPAPARRSRQAEEGIIRLEDDGDSGPVALPSDSRIRMTSSPGRLEISMPRGGFRNPVALGMGAFSLFWLAFVAFWTFSAVAMGAPIFFALFSLPFWAVGIGMARSTLASLFRQTSMVFDSGSGLVLTERLLGKGRTRSWPIADLGSCSVKGAAFQTKGANEKELVLEAGARSLRIGKALSERELRSLSDAINSWRREGER